MWFNYKNVSNNNLFFMLIIVIKILIKMNTVSTNSNASDMNMNFLEGNTSEYENLSVDDTYLMLISSLPLADFILWNNTDLINGESDSNISISATHGMPVKATQTIPTITPTIKITVDINRKFKQHQLVITPNVDANELLKILHNSTHNNIKTISNDNVSSLSLFSVDEKAEKLLANTTFHMLNLQLPDFYITAIATTAVPTWERTSPLAPSITNIDDHILHEYPENLNNNRKRNHLLIRHDDDVDDDEYNADRSYLGNNGTVKYNRKNSLNIKYKKFLQKYRSDSSNSNSNNDSNVNVNNNYNNNNNVSNVSMLSSLVWNTFSLRNSIISNNSVIIEMQPTISPFSASSVILPIAATTVKTTTIAKTIPSITRISARKIDHINYNTNSNIKNKYVLTNQQQTDTPMLNYIFDIYSSANRHHHHDQRYGPHFEDVQQMGQPTNLTAQAGNSIFLNCRIFLLQDKTVSWVRRNAKGESALDLLTVGLHTYTGDNRYKIEFQYPSNWRLKITNVKKDDEATYECQISTHPPRVIQINLHVNEPKVMIVDEFADPLQEKYYEIDSTLQLSCVIRNVAMSSSVVLWKHGETVLNYDVTRGGVSVKTELMDNGANSTLYIAKIGKIDSGNYTCSINEYQNYTIAVHILNGESFAELHHSKAYKVIYCPRVLVIRVALLIKLLFYACPPTHINR